MKDVTKAKIRKAFGSKKEAYIAITCSAPALDRFIKQGFFPEICTRGVSSGKNWHEILRNLGFNPDLSPL